ncbi:hypothetical protein BWQ96_01667 [Gracilariopsis chorda]|uniref:C2H2-type domain-containing protein n=1 Tax=Gracilariopsis chorda TaxID=448386 RepID=A0A2V3J277_9FLOR|nr:hypothetical protein BWQ96_01667 [Gracilariopsis chorda]|eukprot:PXF48498.1 hypothetical protein BWQ96_01667 [Gracilariopsis chorda]
MASSPRALHTCSKCAKKFGKVTKLERHLLESHGATLSIPPPTDPPSPSFLLVETQLESALAEANRRFQLADPTCRLCVVKRPFKNSRDLAQHLVSKHSDALMCAEALPLPSLPSTSEVSANPNPRDKVRATPAYSNKRTQIEQSTVESDQPPLKRAKTAPKQRQTPTTYQQSSSANPTVPRPVSKSLPKDVPGNPKTASALPNDVSPKPSTENTTHTTTKNAPPISASQSKQSKPKHASSPDRSPVNNRTKSNALANHASALSSNSSSRSGTPSSGTKPPVTPKRTKAVLPPKESMKRAASPNRDKATQNATAKPTAAVPTPVPFLNPLRNVSRVLSIPLDFSAAGFGANTRKSYYTLKNS